LDGPLSVEISSATIGERHAHATGAPSWVSSARPQTSIRSIPLDSNTHKRRCYDIKMGRQESDLGLEHHSVVMGNGTLGRIKPRLSHV